MHYAAKTMIEETQASNAKLHSGTSVLRPLKQGGDNVGAEVLPSEGLVSPLSAVAVSITLRPLAPGDVHFTCWVNIAGLDNPFQLDVSACASGPKLKIEPKELHWGKVCNQATLRLAPREPATGC